MNISKTVKKPWSMKSVTCGGLFFLCATILMAEEKNALPIKCWENKKGVKECGQSVPPEHSQKAHWVISKDGGRIISKKERALTEEERIALKKIEEEEKKTRALEKAEQRKKDVLLRTFLSVQDIEIERDRNINLLKNSIEASKIRGNRLQEQLKDTSKKALQSNPEHKDDWNEELASLEKQVRLNEKIIKRKQNDLMKIEQEYVEKIKLFQSIK